MNNNPLISITTVYFKKEKKIKDTLNSVLRQSYFNIEYTLIDGRYKGKTMEITNSYEDRLEEKGIHRCITEPGSREYIW